MRRSRFLIVVVAVASMIAGAYNCYLLTEARLLVWAIAFAVSVPLLAAARAWSDVRSGDDRLAMAVVTGAALVQGAMLPLAERLAGLG